MKTSATLPLPSKQYTRDCQWIVRQFKKLSVEYPNNWIAVHKGRVVAVGDDSGTVKSVAQQRAGFLDIPVEFVDDGTIIF